MTLPKKKILLIFLLSSVMLKVQARNPYSFIQKSYTAYSSSFAVKAYSAPLQPMLMHSNPTAKPFKSFAALMAWDFKLKIKLNSNMNIVFSYN